MNPQIGLPILVLALVALLAACVFFAICRRFDDGVLGLLCLIGMGIAIGLLLADAWRNEFAPPPPEWCLLVVSAAGFICRYAVRTIWFNWKQRILTWWRVRRDPGATIPGV